MAKVLYITANPKAEEHSYSLSVGRSFIATYKELNAQDNVVEIDLFKENIPYIDENVFSGWGKLQQGSAFDQLSSDEQAKVARLGELVDQFVSADKVVFVTPLWNFSFPPVVKAYIDSICVAGKTFKYTENGPVGLQADKKVVHIQARGGIYSEGPAKDMEFGDRYLRTVLGFVGITNVQTVAVEGMAMFPNEAEGIREKAIKQAVELAKLF
jgi:FMN-dependent NADH-azoreductase